MARVLKPGGHVYAYTNFAANEGHPALEAIHLPLGNVPANLS